MEQSINLNGYTISYSRLGRGPRAALLVHGWGSSRAWWVAMAEGLADRYTCYVVDLVGFGRSSKPCCPEPFHIERQAELLAALIERLDLAPVYLIGHSMGGQISVTLAHRYPHLVDRLVVFNLVLTGRCGSFLRAGQLALKIPLLGRPLFTLGFALSRWTLPSYHHAFKLMLARPFGPAPAGVKDFIVRTYPDYRDLPARSAIFALEAFTSFDLRPFMAGVVQPALVICGREDKQIPPDDSRLLAETLPRARIEWLSPAGHNPFVEHPAACLELVRAFGPDEAPASGQNAPGRVSYRGIKLKT